MCLLYMWLTKCYYKIMNESTKDYLKLLKVVNITYIVIFMLFLFSVLNGLIIILNILLHNLWASFGLVPYFSAMNVNIPSDSIFHLNYIFITFYTVFSFMYGALLNFFNLPFILIDKIFYLNFDIPIDIFGAENFLLNFVFLDVLLLVLCFLGIRFGFFICKAIKREYALSEPSGKVLFLIPFGFIVQSLLCFIIPPLNFLLIFNMYSTFKPPMM